MKGTLFQQGEFVLHSGDPSNFKIDCDAFGDSDWQTIAEIIREQVPSFGAVYGIPRGGLPLQRVLEGYACGLDTATLLIVDDVYTTGRSMRDAMVRCRQHMDWHGPILGVVVFARAPIREDWVQALWTMSLERESPANLRADLMMKRTEVQQLHTKLRERR